MFRVRFHANAQDPRPIKWPVKLPYWITGYGDDYAIVVAYVDNIEEITELWPEATNLDAEQRDNITFTSRFAKPSWWDETTAPHVTI